MIRFLLMTLCLIVSISHTVALTKAEIEVRFLAESAPADLGKVALAFEKTRMEPFDLPVNNLSTPQKPTEKVFSLWAMEKNVSLATITLPEDGKSFIVLLLTTPKGGYTPVVMRSDDPAFKPGDIYFYNNADKPVLGIVGTEKFTLAPSNGKVLRPKGARAEKFYDVGLGVREPEGDRVLCTTRWPEDNQARFYVFFYLNPATKRIAYRAVDEFVPVEKPVP